MISSVKKLIGNLHDENGQLKQEIKELKQKLQHRHTEINDLRYAKRVLINKLRLVENNEQSVE